MKDIIFIGGFENTGTRLVIRFLLDIGYITPPRGLNTELDWLGASFWDLFLQYWSHNNREPLYNNIDLDSNTDKNVVIKHGHLCFLNKDLKARYPCSRHILCIRNPLDILIKDSHNYQMLGGLGGTPTIEEKLGHLKLWYSDDIIENSDVVIKLEEMIFDTRKTLRNLVDTLDISCTNEQIDNFCKIIVPSSTISKGNSLLNTENEEVIHGIMEFSKKFNY